MTRSTGFARTADATWRVAFLSTAAALVLAGCGTLGIVAPTPTIYDEAGMPRFASVVVTGEPPTATRDLELTLLTLPEAVELRTIDIP